ncbi:MAG: phage baseplate assembly protein V [Clostridiales bacterium]|nr:phage baseplate assembly protein V [Clostridiales bacterium]
MNEHILQTALVIDNNDTEKLGRVRLTLPTLPEGPELWAKVVSPLAGQDRGHCFLPEIGDEVLVAFIRGDLSSAYVLGGLWGTQKLPPEGLGSRQNDLKMIKTRCGHLLEFDDKDGSERITLTDKNDNCLVIDTAKNCITITSQSKLEIKAENDMILNAGKKITINATEIEIKADSSLNLDGGGTADLKAGTVNIN